MTGPGGVDAKAGVPATPASPVSISRRFAQRVPLLTAAAAFAGGIVADHRLDIPVSAMLQVALVGACAALALRSWPRVASIAILLALAGLGAARHHHAWTARPTDDISRIELANDSPIRLIGVVDSPVDVRQADDSPATPAWRRLDQSSFNLRAEKLVGVRSLAVGGLVRIDVAGHVPDLEVGNRLEVLGHIRVPGDPRDPEGFDLRAWLRSQGIDRAVSVEHPEAVVRLGDASTLTHRMSRVRHSLRGHCEKVLADNLSSQVRAVGTSLLLGTRTGITNEIRDAFINSGTMHLLAISGLHVAILAGLVFACCRLAGVSTNAMVVIVLVTLWSYALITDLRPPVLRSAVLGCLVVVAMPSVRQTSGFNLLAGTAFLMLLWNPLDLFDLGAQLSFLAVAAIMWSATVLAARRRRLTPDPLAAEPMATSRHWNWMWRKVAEGYAVTAAIWLFTLPLTLAWFHLFSPVGFLINVVLVPFSGPLLAAGFATLAVGLIAPSLAWIPGLAYDLCLRVLLAIVRWASGTPFAYVSSPGPAVWQLVVFYGLLAATILLPSDPWRRRTWKTLGVTVALMLAWSIRPLSRAELTVTFLDVGHGGAVLFQFPGGETALFDAGSFGRGEAAEDTIHRALLSRRLTGLNALILSHADADHYNAAAGLIQRLPVGVVYVSQAFPDVSQASVSALCESIVKAGPPLRFLQAGDGFRLSGDCTMEVLHPAGSFRDDLDNAHSIVLRTRYAGQTVIVTGDVEKKGVRAMLEAHPAERIEVFQAPHHGGRTSNTTDLARWALPRYVVACNRDDVVLPRLREVYADADRILTSAGHGTVTAAIDRNGEVRMSTTRGGSQ
jgi:competence protein ComEC